MNEEFSVEGPARLPLLGAVQARLDTFAAHHAWSEEARFQISLALEEVLMNVISHGGMRDNQPPTVRVSLSQDERDVTLEIADDGIAFDPRQAPAPDLESDLDERSVGGLGVFLVQQLMDDVDYRRDEGWNRLVLRKRLS